MAEKYELDRVWHMTPLPVREGAFSCGSPAGSIDGDNRFPGGAEYGRYECKRQRNLYR